MSRPVTDDERAGIVEAIKAGGTCSGIARDFERARGTVSKIAKTEGLTFDRSKTKAATEARRADNAEQRIRLSETMLTKARELAATLPDTVAVHTAADVRAVAIAIKVLSQGAIEAEEANRRGSEEDHTVVGEWLDWVLSGGAHGRPSTGPAELTVVTGEGEVA